MFTAALFVNWVGCSEVDEFTAYYTEWSKSEIEKNIVY